MNIPYNDTLAHHRKIIELTECPETIKVTHHRLSEIKEKHTQGVGRKDMISVVMEECELKMKLLDVKVQKGIDYEIEKGLRDPQHLSH